MVGRWGMSPAIGKLTVLPAEDGRPFAGLPEISPRTQQLVDEEARRIVDEADADVHELLQANRERLDVLAQALLEHETLDEDEAYAAAGVPHVMSDEERQAEAALARRV
jgi:cell division protease FtsH